MEWYTWLFGAGTLTLILYVALLVFAKPVLDVVIGLLGGLLLPIGRALGEWFADWFRITVEGLWMVLDNRKTIVAAITLMLLSSVTTYAWTYSSVKQQVIQDLHEDYKFVPKPKKKWFR